MLPEYLYWILLDQKKANAGKFCNLQKMVCFDELYHNILLDSSQKVWSNLNIYEHEID